MGIRKLDVFLYGSCVSRDLQEQSSDLFYRRAYIARQSLISAMTPPYLFEGEHRLDSAWQHRMVQGDLASNLLVRLSEAAPRTDLLIWDLTDERMGVLSLGDGSYGTITPDSLRSGILEAFEEQGGPVRLGSRRHLRLWEDSFERFLGVLEALGLRSRTYVLAPQWADHDATGEQIEPEGGRPPADWERAFAPYLARIAAAGLEVLSLPEELVRTDHGHKWGAAPYHYVDAAYAHWAREIRERAGEDGKRPVHPVLPEPGDPPADGATVGHAHASAPAGPMGPSAVPAPEASRVGD